jgi:predicted secreted protein
MTSAQPQVVRAETGQVFDVRLEGVPTSGYQWELDTDGLADLLELVADDAAPSAPSVAGGSATQAFRFRAIRAGQAMVRFRYRRRWENVPIREVQVTVIIYDKTI